MPALLNRPRPTSAEVFTGELAQNGNWVVACIEPHFPWPTTVQKLVYRGNTLYFIPQCGDYYPCIVVKLGDGVRNFEQGQTLILNLLSVMAWVEEAGADVDQWTGGNLPRPMAGYSRSGIHVINTESFSHHYLPDIADEKARWALAFYREGMSIRQVPYAFLSFYKVINILQSNGPRQKGWIDSSIDAAVDASRSSSARQRLVELRASSTNIGEYLYESGRCAVAHAGHGTTVDPENPADLKRLQLDMPLVKSLAAFAIEHEFGVKSRMTVYKEHLYELAGFRELFGAELTEKLRRKDAVGLIELPPIPPLTVGLHGEPPYPSLVSLDPRPSAIEEGIVYLDCVSANNRTRMMLGLDFPNERLLSDTFGGLLSSLDDTAQSVEDAISTVSFRRAHFANGQLMVSRADTGALMGRCDAFLPTNVDGRGTMRNIDAAIEQLRRLLEERRRQ